MTLAIRKRPVLITIACILGYIAVICYFVGVFSPAIKKLGDLYPAVLGLIVAVNFISVIGVWNMKRWGINLYILVFFAKLLFQVLIDDIGSPGIVIAVFFISAVLPYYNRMDRNL